MPEFWLMCLHIKYVVEAWKEKPFSKSTENTGSGDRSNSFKILHFYRVQNTLGIWWKGFFISVVHVLNLFFPLVLEFLTFMFLLMDIEEGGFLGLLSGRYHNVA